MTRDNLDEQLKRNKVTLALGEISKILQADGADLDVLGLECNTVRTRLLLGTEACLECIMPKDVLEEIMLMSLKESMPEVERVQLDDPREG